MNYSEKTKPGMGDPYWYEWSVGEQQIINMLNEDNLISDVLLHSSLLYSLEKKERAVDLFNRWFGGLNVFDFGRKLF